MVTSQPETHGDDVTTRRFLPPLLKTAPQLAYE